MFSHLHGPIKNMPKKIVTHNSSFHTDDIFAVAILLMITPDALVVRSRDQAEIDSADYVVDVGMVYEPSRNRFDHHMRDGAGARENGIPYASFGLVWKQFGEELSGGKRQAEVIDRYLIQAIDAIDNGVAIAENKFEGIRAYTIGDFFYSFIVDADVDQDSLYKIFMQNVEMAKELLKREITRAHEFIAGEDLFKTCYENSIDRRLIELPKEGVPWEIMAAKFPEPIYVLYPCRDGNWGIGAVPDLTKPYGYIRKPLPLDWAGKKGKDLQKITGVEDALFTHNKRFMASVGSKEGALELAKIALNA